MATTAHELLMNSPDTQVGRCKRVIAAIANGEWSEASFILKNAIRETEGTTWCETAKEVELICGRNANPYALSPTNKTASNYWTR